MKCVITKLIPLFLFLNLEAIQIGSDSAVSREAHATFPSTDSNNTILGFASMENGFDLEDLTTQCTFNSLFPVTGLVNLGCGTLFLQRDFIMGQGVSLNTFGSMYGNGYSVQCPLGLTYVRAATFQLTIGAPSQVTPAARVVNSVDWRYDGAYVVAAQVATSQTGLYVYPVTAGVLGVAISANLTTNGLCTRWHPSSNYIAVGKTASGTGGNYEMQLFLYTPGVSLVAGGAGYWVNYNGHNARAVAWAPAGNYLAVAYDTTGRLDVYVWPAGGPLGTLYSSANFSATENPSQGAMTFNPTGAYIAIGFTDATASSLRIYSFSGSSAPTVLTSVGTGTVGVTAVAWSASGNYIAAGLANGYVQIYKFVSNSLSLITQLYVGAAVYSVDWNAASTVLAVGTAAQTGRELRFYYFDLQTTLLSVEGYEMAIRVNSVRWNNTSSYICTGDSSNRVSVFPISTPVLREGTRFTNLSFSINDNMSWASTTTLQGSCVIDGQGKTINLTSAGRFVVSPQSNLVLQNLTLTGVGGTNISCLDNTASISLRNCTISLNDNYTLTNGSMYFSGDVTWAGTYTFTYASIMTSTIAANTNLYFSQGFTFSYGPNIVSEQLLFFTDISSQLTLDGASLYTSGTSLTLKVGTMVVKQPSYFNAMDGSTIRFGDDIAADDLICSIQNGASMVFQSGKFEYRDVNVSNFSAAGFNSSISVYGGVTFDLYENFNIGSGFINLYNGATLRHVPTTSIGSSVFTQGSVTYGLLPLAL